jgi:signal transduction histidine kinase
VVAGAALRPVERIRQDAAQLSAADPAGRLTVPATGDELARLAETLNDLLRRQQEAMEHERRFVDEASHELRTPLARGQGGTRPRLEPSAQPGRVARHRPARSRRDRPAGQAG